MSLEKWAEYGWLKAEPTQLRSFGASRLRSRSPFEAGVGACHTNRHRTATRCTCVAGKELSGAAKRLTNRPRGSKASKLRSFAASRLQRLFESHNANAKGNGLALWIVAVARLGVRPENIRAPRSTKTVKDPSAQVWV